MFSVNSTILSSTPQSLSNESPDEEEDSSLFYVFGRLNSGGRKVTAQEIRTAVYGGPFIDLIESLNLNSTWRTLFGKESVRLKDHELILRFLALYSQPDKYERPMEEFLNKFCRQHRMGPTKFLKTAEPAFKQTLQTINAALGPAAFRPTRAMNAAVFDSIAVAIARRLDKGPITNHATLRKAFDRLSQDDDYIAATSRATSDETNVATRLRLATSAFAGLK